MSTTIERLEQYVQADPHAPVLFDEVHAKGLTYAQIDEMSGRVYAWLKQSGIGREDFVLINLPRGVMPVIGMLGTWKAGAAWALVEDTYAPDRIDYIRKDCGCKAELNAEMWDIVMTLEPLSGHEDTDPHDAAYAIYTSGTMGNPKGVLHEYGNLEQAVDSIRINRENVLRETDRCATLAPLNFVASVIVILTALSVFRGQNYIASYATIKNPMKLAKLFLSRKITVTFLTPSYVQMLKNRKSPYLRMLFVGSEPANDLYVEGMDLINIYASSESGFAVGVFLIDRAYDICPIGQPQTDTRITLITEEGTEAKEGETGELCYENPYVRGYINLPEATAKAFIDGVYHSGDLARRDADGNYILLGRNDDMIKINGNRIEPAEIEAAVKDALGIDWCAVKGVEKNGKSWLCAYYTANITVDQDQVRRKLEQRLPYYMIPSFYIHIDKVPLKASGKMDRRALPVPEVSFAVSDYVPPENEVQEKICNAIAQVMQLEQVGIHDDFYELGGDSLTSIKMVSACDLPGLSTAEIFHGRTPEKIALLYEKALAQYRDGTPEERNEEALREAHPLTAEQRYMVNYQLYTPNSTMYNLFSMMRLDKGLIPMTQAARIMKESIDAHPALLTTFFWDEDGNLMQKYDPALLEEIPVEHLTEYELNFVKDTLVYPFKIVGGKMYRCRIFETEKAGYVFFDVHHSLFDGTSMKVFMNSMRNALLELPQETDFYYLMLKNREKAAMDEFYAESRQYFEDRYNGIEWSSYPKTDHMSRDNEMGELMTELGIEGEQLAAVERKYRITRNELFITVAALSIRVYNNTPDIMLSWIYNGREDRQMMTSVGLLFRDLPVGIRFSDTASLREVFADVQEQVRLGIEHSCYPYVDLNNEVGEREAAYLLYQQDIRDMGGMEGMDIEMVDVRQNQAASQTILDMEILDGEDGLQLMIDFAASRYETASMTRFNDIFIRIVHILAQRAAQEELTIGEIRRILTELTIEELRGRVIGAVRQKAEQLGTLEKRLGGERKRSGTGLQFPGLGAKLLGMGAHRNAAGNLPGGPAGHPKHSLLDTMIRRKR